jgi:hypothetical protein
MTPWLMVFALGAGPALAEGPEPSAGQATAQLLALQSFVGKDELEPPTAGLDSSDCSVRLLSAALHYRREPERYRSAFFAALVIDDYEDRAKGRYNMVAVGEAAALLESAMVAPDGATDERVRRVVGFCALRDRNLWVSTETQPRISLARMVRGAALVSLLEGTDEDALAIANAIDAHTSAGTGR